MHFTFTKEPLHIDDVVVYLKNERTGSSTVRKCKFLGRITGFTNTKVEIKRLSPPDTFVTPEECGQFDTDKICPEDVVHIIISEYQESRTVKTFRRLNSIIDNRDKDVNFLLGRWFSALEDEGIDPWTNEECMMMANKHYYTEADYKSYLRTLV